MRIGCTDVYSNHEAYCCQGEGVQWRCSFPVLNSLSFYQSWNERHITGLLQSKCHTITTNRYLKLLNSSFLSAPILGCFKASAYPIITSILSRIVGDDEQGMYGCKSTKKTLRETNQPGFTASAIMTKTRAMWSTTERDKYGQTDKRTDS